MSSNLVGREMAAPFPDVLRAAQSGEGWAFDALFEQWNSPMTGFVVGRGIRDSDDVVNEIFLGAFRSISSFAGDESAFRSWIFRIARNKIADEFRQMSRQPVTTPLDPKHLQQAGFIARGDVESDADQRMGRDRMNSLLSHLTDDQREVLVLRTVADLTIDQIADITGRRRGAVKQLQRRGLRRLEQVLAETEHKFSDSAYPYALDER